MKPLPLFRAFALATLSACALVSVSAQSPHPTGQIVGVAHIAYRVTNLDREVAFLGKLGFQQSFVIAANGQTTEAVIKINDNQFFEIYPQTSPSQPLGWMHVSYEVGDLSAFVPALTAQGLKPSPITKTAAGNLFFTLKDPDGRITEFTQFMPGSRHTLDRGQHLGATRVSTELLGLELPVTDLKVSRAFYTSLGFNVDDTGSGLRLSLQSNNDLRIELPQYRPGLKVQALLPVSDANSAADRIRAAGINANLQKKLVFVQDPDGNSLVLLETSGQ
jgi:catechol 2,3-dioxygenase-like lactoylglutathione lyase family enzyme